MSLLVTISNELLTSGALQESLKDHSLEITFPYSRRRRQTNLNTLYSIDDEELGHQCKGRHGFSSLSAAPADPNTRK